jgi:surface polysaccharide O-acyltransferase-like enzyme
MDTGKSRESNFELLRIFSMFYIVTYHFIVYAIKPGSPGLDYLMNPLTNVLHIGVICFVLISGYWGIKFSLKSFTKLFIQCSFYSILIYLTFSLINPEQYNLKDLIQSVLPFQWWYIQIYLCFYLLTPVINIPLKTNSVQKKVVYIVILGIVSFVFGQFIPGLSDGKNCVNFIFIYYIGDYLRTCLKLKPKRILLYYVIFNLVLFFCSMLFQKNTQPGNLLYRFIFPYNSVGLIFNAILLFLFFSKLTIKSKTINWIAASMLPVYMIHENHFLSRYLYGAIANIKDSLPNPLVLILSLFLLAIIVISVCVVIDKLLSPFYKLIENAVINSKYFEKLNSKIEQILL